MEASRKMQRAWEEVRAGPPGPLKRYPAGGSVMHDAQWPAGETAGFWTPAPSRGHAQPSLGQGIRRMVKDQRCEDQAALAAPAL